MVKNFIIGHVDLMGKNRSCTFFLLGVPDQKRPFELAIFDSGQPVFFFRVS